MLYNEINMELEAKWNINWSKVRRRLYPGLVLIVLAVLAGSVFTANPFGWRVLKRPWASKNLALASWQFIEKQAVYDSGLTSGWLLWNPRNVYTEEALDLDKK